MLTVFVARFAAQTGLVSALDFIMGCYCGGRITNVFGMKNGEWVLRFDSCALPKPLWLKLVVGSSGVVYI